MNSLERGDMLCKCVHHNDSFPMLVPLIVITQYKSGTGIVHTTSEPLCLPIECPETFERLDALLASKHSAQTCCTV